MTDFEKVKGYYSVFKEDERLERDASGKLEFELTMRKLQKYLPASATILNHSKEWFVFLVRNRN